MFWFFRPLTLIVSSFWKIFSLLILFSIWSKILFFQHQREFSTISGWNLLILVISDMNHFSSFWPSKWILNIFCLKFSHSGHFRQTLVFHHTDVITIKSFLAMIFCEAFTFNLNPWKLDFLSVLEEFAGNNYFCLTTCTFVLMLIYFCVSLISAKILENMFNFYYLKNLLMLFIFL